TWGDSLQSLPNDSKTPSQTELAIMDKIFKNKSKRNNKEGGSEKKGKESLTENNQKDDDNSDGDGKKKNIFLLVLIGGVISATLSLPFFGKLLNSCGCKNIFVQFIVHFIVFVLAFFLFQRHFG